MLSGWHFALLKASSTESSHRVGVRFRWKKFYDIAWGKIFFDGNQKFCKTGAVSARMMVGDMYTGLEFAVENDDSNYGTIHIQKEVQEMC